MGGTVGPTPLLTYLYCLTIVVLSGGYYSAPFKGYRKVIQVGTLSPPIFNVVVDIIVQHWIFL